MYAVIKSGGRQYRVEPGDVINIEKIPTEAGQAVTFDQVLLVRGDENVEVGTPYVDGASVTATVVAQDRARKILVFKFKRRKNYKRIQGHRQHRTQVRIDDIHTA